MRLAVCALSAVLLSGCSWLGMGGGHGDSYGYNYGQQSGWAGGYGAQGCVPMQGGHHGMQQYGYQVQQAQVQCAPGTGYNVAHGGVTHGGPGGLVSAGGYGQAGYGMGGATMLGGAAPYGAAAGGVQTVQGAPIYVQQPYGVQGGMQGGVPGLRGASYGYNAGYGGSYGYGGSNCIGGYGAGCGSAMPFGVELFGGTDFDIGGDIFTEKDPGPSNTNPAVQTGGTDGISYDDAFGQAIRVGGSFGYDVSRNTTVLGTVAYSTASGQTVDAYQSVDARNPGTLEDIDATFTDLDTWTIEGGVRQYFGQNPALRPYVGASAGFVHNNDIEWQRTYSSDGANFDATPQVFAESGWNPTAAATIGAEMAVGHRAAIGVETGIRWQDNMDTTFESDDRISIPVSLRGRVAF